MSLEYKTLLQLSFSVSGHTLGRLFPRHRLTKACLGVLGNGISNLTQCFKSRFCAWKNFKIY